MIFSDKNRKELIDFLIRRWRIMIAFAAQEKIYTATCEYAKKNNLPPPPKPFVVAALPCRQITVIKNIIMRMLPETHFIDYEYEAQAPLDPKDYAEVYIADHHQCVDKVETVMKKMKVT
jgi:hypothetical protein